MPEEEKKTVELDTSGPEVNVDIEEKKDETKDEQKKEEGEKEKYIGEYWPDFFETKKKHTKDNPREAEKGRSYRINLLTNAQNDYFSRSQNQGSWKIFRFNEDITYKSGVQLSGFDGKWTLTLPEIETELQHYRLEVSDIKKYNNPIICEFFLKLQDKKDRPNSETNNKKNKSVQFNLPKIIPLTRDNFEEYEIDELDILYVNQTMDDNEFYNFFNAPVYFIHPSHIY